MKVTFLSRSFQPVLLALSLTVLIAGCAKTTHTHEAPPSLRFSTTGEARAIKYDNVAAVVASPTERCSLCLWTHKEEEKDSEGEEKVPATPTETTGLLDGQATMGHDSSSDEEETMPPTVTRDHSRMSTFPEERVAISS